MTDTNRLGPAVGVVMVRRAFEQLARDWIADYLADACAEHGKARDWAATPRAFSYADEVTMWPSKELPALVAAVPGTTGTPERRARQVYVATWQVTMGAFVRGIDNDDTELQASVYGVALRQLVLKQAAAAITSMAVESVAWAGTGTDPIPQRPEGPRYLMAASEMFEVVIAGSANAQPGLAEPSVSPPGNPGPYPTADTVNVNVEPTS